MVGPYIAELAVSLVKGQASLAKWGNILSCLRAKLTTLCANVAISAKSVLFWASLTIFCAYVCRLCHTNTDATKASDSLPGTWQSRS